MRMDNIEDRIANTQPDMNWTTELLPIAKLFIYLTNKFAIFEYRLEIGLR